MPVRHKAQQRQWRADWLTVQKVRALALVLVVSITGLGYLIQRNGLDGEPAIGAILADFYVNVVIALASIAIALLVIDSLNVRSAEEQLKAKLIRELGNTDHGIALQALRELRARRWLEDGSLRGANLMKANLRRAYLTGGDLQEAVLFRADLREADLVGANLQGAYLAKANLEEADLQGANLRGADLRGANLRKADLQEAILEGAILRDTDLEGATMTDGLKYEDWLKDGPA